LSVPAQLMSGEEKSQHDQNPSIQFACRLQKNALTATENTWSVKYAGTGCSMENSCARWRTRSRKWCRQICLVSEYQIGLLPMPSTRPGKHYFITGKVLNTQNRMSAIAVLLGYNLSTAIYLLTLQRSLHRRIADREGRITIFWKVMRMAPVRDLIIISVVENSD